MIYRQLKRFVDEASSKFGFTVEVVYGEIPHVALYRAAEDKIRFNPKRVGGLSLGVVRRFVFEELAHAYEARLSAQEAFFPFFLKFNLPLKNQHKEDYIRECLRQIWDYAARRFIFQKFGIYSDDPSIDERTVETWAGDPLAEMAFFDQFCHAGNQKLRELCRKGITNEDFQALERWLKPYSITASKAEKVALLNELFISLLDVTISTEPLDEVSVLHLIGRPPPFYPARLDVLVCYY